jgi:lia operon protein LiaG
MDFYKNLFLRGIKMKKYLITIFLSMILLTGCNFNQEEVVHSIDLDGIDTIYIDHGSENVHLISVEQSNLEVLHSNKNIDVSEKANEVSISMEKRIFNIGPKINLNNQLIVKISKDFTGKVIINGTSGNVTSEDLETTNIEVNEKSGNVTLDFKDFHSDVNITTSSGNVVVSLNTIQPDIELQTKTASGLQTITVPIDIEKQNDKSIEGKANEGIYFIGIKTASGNISIR